MQASWIVDVDKYFMLHGGPVEQYAWDNIRKELVVGQKPTTNTQSTAELSRVRITCAQIAARIDRECEQLTSYLPERLRVMFRDCAQQLRTL